MKCFVTLKINGVETLYILSHGQTQNQILINNQTNKYLSQSSQKCHFGNFTHSKNENE